MDNGKLLQEINQSYKAAKRLVEPLIERRRRNLELYTGFNPYSNVENSDNIKIHVPYVKTLFDGVFPLLTNKMPISKVTARDSEKSFVAAKFMDRLINYTFDVNKFEEKYMMTRKESMIGGDAYTLVIWSSDPDKNYPVMIHLNSDEVYPHPNKLDIDDEWPIYIKREMTKKQMKETGWNKGIITSLGKSKLGNKSYRREQLKKLGLYDSATMKDENPKDDLYEVVMRYGMMDFKDDEDGTRKMGLVVAANEEKIINTDAVMENLQPFESPYLNNVMPIAHLQYDKLPHSFFSMSFIDPISDMQIELNDLENMKRANYYRRNNPPIIVDRDGDVDLSTLSFKTGLPWLVTGGAKNIEPYILPDLAPSIENQQHMVRQTMQNVTGANDMLNVSPDTLNKASGMTATQSSIMNESTKVHFRPQAVYEDKYIEKIGKLLINLWQDKKFFNEEIALAISDEEGQNEIKFIKNEMIQGDLDFVVKSASGIAQSDNALLNQAVQIKELYMQDQSKDLTEVDKRIFDKSGFDYNKIQKPKMGMLPELTSRLKRLIFLTNQQNFKTLPQNEQSKVYDQIEIIKGMIQELQSKVQSETAEKTPLQQEQPMQPQSAGQPSIMPQGVGQ
jgi:hypothetical protein